MRLPRGRTPGWPCLLGVLPAALALAGAVIRPADAATITVTSLADNLTIDGQVTLREAIVAANTDTSVDGSPPGSGPDDILFATGSGTIVLGGTPLPTITAALSITGPGAALLALHGNDLSRVLEVATGVSASIGRLTIRNGRVTDVFVGGGGILNSGTLTVVESTFSANAVAANGGAILNQGGTLTLAKSVFTANTALNGGAIANEGGSLDVLDTTLDGNATGGIAPSPGGGGAILSTGAGSTVIDRCTLSNNFAGNGGAVTASSGALTVRNSTLSGNQALNNGGAIFSVATLTLQGDTLVFNLAQSGSGGGLRVTGGSATVHGTIVAHNQSGTPSPVPSDISGTLQSASSFNLVGVNTGLVGISNGSNGNQVGTAASPLDAGLGPLRDNGGLTRTHALLATSSALEAGSLAVCLSVDQRLFSRPLDGNNDGLLFCDIGAYEAFFVGSQPADYFTVIPCRLADTRLPPSQTGGPALPAGTTRFFPGAGLCGVPSDARAVLLNVVVVNAPQLGNLRLFPAGSNMPPSATLNFPVNTARGNNAAMPVGAAGLIAVQCSAMTSAGATVHVVLDVFGYFK